jgi:4-hydroxybenzoate polyprenyltransferase
MGYNRIADRRIDADNPRTRDRELPTGAVSLRTAWIFTLAASAGFLAAAFALGPLTGALAVPCLLIVFAYSLFKRFSWASHLVLGVALSLSPGGAWLAVTGSFAGTEIVLWLMLAVATWVAGFDVLYALHDEAFDRARGLHSIPARFGARGALWLSGLLHVGTVAALLAFHRAAALGGWHLVGVTVVVAILAYEHAIVRPGDLRRLDRAFFDLNGWVGIVYLATVVLERALA